MVACVWRKLSRENRVAIAAIVDEPQSLVDQRKVAIYIVLQRSNPFNIKGLSNGLNQKNDIYGKTWHVYCN
jgi:hypothetical protein